MHEGYTNLIYLGYIYRFDKRRSVLEMSEGWLSGSRDTSELTQQYIFIILPNLSVKLTRLTA